MTFRARPANLRQHEAIAIEHEGQRYKIGLGRQIACNGSCGGHYRFTPVVEVFLNGQKVNSPIDVLVSDAAILMSMLIQYGCPPADIFHAMKRNPDGSPASPLGRAAAYLVEEQ
ncbi:hypothetical protein MA20_32030 [Bradyrhizobium japonicum]|uniref:Uncharacterized protein n=1 Tax=Bradyrhizobium japonicum TaxID=375 RepID=A0A0A3XN56_BRAJP|nr:hypothetical protein [Bradyrhizobium japonicum]KGT75820.1 hypothetical protein MA20_32030 [Bradyrhizobium japonicum]